MILPSFNKVNWDDVVKSQAKAQQDYCGTAEPDFIDVEFERTEPIKEVKFISSDNKKWGKQ